MASEKFTQYAAAVKDVITTLRDRYDRFVGSSQGLMFSKGEGSGNIEFDSPLKLTPMIVDSQEEADLTKGYAESFERVFESWLRISRSGSETHNTTGDLYTLLAREDETQAWEYDTENDRINCTVNSATLIGFISPQVIENYTVEARIRVTSGDDDWVGFCIALAYDDQGRARTLDVLRGLNGRAPLFVDIDYSVDPIEVAESLSPLRWPSNEPATGPLSGNQYDGWNGFPSGVLLKVTREGDIITIETSDLYTPDTYEEDATITIDLNSSPELEIFKGPQRWGYIAHSQDNATWEILQRPVDRGEVYDLSTNTLHRWNNNTWAEEGGGVQNTLKPGRLYYNQNTQKMYYYDPDDLEIVNINTE